MTVLHFHGHQRLRCPGTSDRCAGGYCHACELYMCLRCRGAEGSLPTDCPGRAMTEEESDAVYAQRLDFRWREGWVRLEEKRA